MTLMIRVKEGQCNCGCGEEAGRDFRQGHDAKLKSALIKAHLAGEKVTVDGRTASARTVSERRGWGHFLQRASERRSGGQRRRVSVKVGRWTYDGEVVSVKGGVAKVRFATRDGETRTVERAVNEL
jgi:hypothetical protein